MLQITILLTSLSPSALSLSLSLWLFNQNVTGELACLQVASGGAKKSQRTSAPLPHNYFHNAQHPALGYTAARQEEIHKTELTNQAWAQSMNLSPYFLVDTAFTFDRGTFILTFPLYLISAWQSPSAITVQV